MCLDKMKSPSERCMHVKTRIHWGSSNDDLYIDAIHHEDFSHYDTDKQTLVFNDKSEIHINALRREDLDRRRKHTPADSEGKPLPEHILECLPDIGVIDGEYRDRFVQFVGLNMSIDKDRMKKGIAWMKKDHHIHSLLYDPKYNQWKMAYATHQYYIYQEKGDVDVLVCIVSREPHKLDTQFIFDELQIAEDKPMCTFNCALLNDDRSTAEDYCVFSNGMTVTHYPIHEHRTKESFLIYLPISHRVNTISTSRFSDVEISAEGKYIVISATK